MSAPPSVSTAVGAASTPVDVGRPDRPLIEELVQHPQVQASLVILGVPAGWDIGHRSDRRGVTHACPRCSGSRSVSWSVRMSQQERHRRHRPGAVDQDHLLGGHPRRSVRVPVSRYSVRPAHTWAWPRRYSCSAKEVSTRTASVPARARPVGVRLQVGDQSDAGGGGHLGIILAGEQLLDPGNPPVAIIVGVGDDLVTASVLVTG